MFDIEQEPFPARETKILKFWKTHSIFEKSVRNRAQAPLFSFYDGPPFATGLPHYGHLLAGTIKDVIPRYKTMKGFRVPRRFGWDCHGLPVENEIEKAKGLSGASTIEKYGIAAFNEECRSIVLRYTEEWKSTVNRMGRWVSFENTYRTMDASFMESVWWVFAALWKKGLVYQGFKVMPFSARLGTPLSNFEANLNYKDVDDPSLTVKFKVKDEADTYLLIWTTTPWTLPSNLACVVNPHINYVRLKDKKSKDTFILAKSRVAHYFKDRESYELISVFKGDKLRDMVYEPLFDYFVDRASPQAFHVLLDEFVGEEDGTGIVHAAPAFGEQDFFVCTRESIDLVCPVDQNGRFTQEVPDYEGVFVKDADKDIIKRLKHEDKVFHHGQIRHRYPFCWRSDTPLLYKAVKTWFISVESLKERLIAINQEINWVPEHIKDGRFGKWLENARDWAISRNRYWGTPIPLWVNDEGDFYAISSKEELEKLSGHKITDLHRHFIDDITFEENGKVYRRVPEVFDCWFESGSMPYAQNHFPFDNKQETLDAFPADFIAEGLDQTRGWFYTLTVIAAALFDKPAFKNVIVNGIILAEDGNKMSKRLKNYPDPQQVIDKFGADSIRLYLLHSPAVQADDLRFSERGVELVLRQMLIPLWNSYVFFATYAKICKWTPKLIGKKKPSATIDQWILSRMQKLILDVETALDRYQLSQAVDPFVVFIDQLTNWYIRRSRPRFWESEHTTDRDEAFQTLYIVLLNLVKVAAPFIPFLSESIYAELKAPQDPDSVHLTDYPEYRKELRDELLEEEMQLVQTVVNLGHSLRKEHKLKVRQPLKKAFLISRDQNVLEALKNHTYLIEDELNVHSLEFLDDETSFVDVTVKPNYKVLGKQMGPLMKEAKEVIEALPRVSIEQIYCGKTVDIQVKDQTFTLSLNEVEVNRTVKGDLIASCQGALTVALETTLDEALISEGYAREIVNKINTMRRNEGFEVTDRIAICLDTTARIQKAFEQHDQYIRGEVLADEVHFASCSGTEWDLNGELAIIHIERRPSSN
ncbi:MAG: isoleucine--tRNA ligase [Simkaniaceae bacterium]|nr:isoleucine--tRNA ligase [Simkaniaceae bacterium]MCF7853009.1 isoleucine--tRNA ligase [Simkaniaceae bacterium]